MRDLEIRGTGDIIGTRQHGHIAAVGFHLYTRLLAEAVNKIQPSKKKLIPSESKPLPPAVPVNVDLSLQAGIPADYVSDKNMRLRLYRRLAEIQSEAELDAIVEEFEDRFGQPPMAVSHLIYQLKIKILATRAGLESVTSENGQIVLRFIDDEMLHSLPDLGPYIRAGKTALWIPYRSINDWQTYLMLILQKIASTQGINRTENVTAEKPISQFR